MRQRAIWRAITLLALAIALMPSSAEAQHHYEFRDSLGRYKVVFRPWSEAQQERDTRLSPVAISDHELRLGIATGANDAIMALDYYWPAELGNVYEGSLTNGSTYTSDFDWYTINVDYGYWVRRWLHVGVAASYTGGFSGEYLNFSHELVSRRSIHTISILPQLRFAWLNRSRVLLYSSVAVGASFSLGSLNSNVKFGGATAGLDFKLLGISVGRKWFGFAEVGYGWRGVVNAGFGCRFGSYK